MARPKKSTKTPAQATPSPSDASPSPATTPSPVDAVKADFRNFLYVVWKHLGLPEPTPVQYDIALYLQHGPQRLIIEAFRGVGKSWITSAYVLWLLLNDPQLKILVVSAAQDRADAFSTFTKRLINDIPILHHLRPRKEIGQRDSNVAFDVGPSMPAHAPSVKSVGITGQIVGSRADVIIADDVETPKNSLTVKMRERLSEAVKEFDAVLTPKATSRIIYLGTPQTEMSLYNQVVQRGYALRVWPAELPSDTKVANYKGALAPFIAKMMDDGGEIGAPVDPKRFTEMDLMARRASYGRSGYSLQFMLDTELSDGDRYPLKLSDFIVMDIDALKAPVHLAWGSGPDQIIDDLEIVGFTGDRWHRPMQVSPEWAEFTGSCMFVDPSGRGKDRTGFAVVKYCQGRLFLTRAGALSGGYDLTVLQTLARVAKAENVNLVLVEPNMGDGMFKELLKPVLSALHPCACEDSEWAKGQKEARIIDILEPVLNQHRLVVSPAVIKADLESDDVNHQLFIQLTRITRERGALVHDDVLDAVAGAVQYWTGSMARDESKALDEHRQRLKEQQAAEFVAAMTGKKHDPHPRFFRVGPRR